MVEEIESLLLAQETRIEKHIRELDSNISSVMVMYNSVHKKDNTEEVAQTLHPSIINIRMLTLKAIIQEPEPEDGITSFIITT